MLDIESVEQVAALTSTAQLQEVLRHYNWDDGFDIPAAVSNHPHCDLAVALTLFWLSDAISVYLGEAEEHSYNKEWFEFCRAMTQRILDGHYRTGVGVFKSELSRVQEYKLRKRGVPEMLITGKTHTQLAVQGPTSPPSAGTRP